MIVWNKGLAGDLQAERKKKKKKENKNPGWMHPVHRAQKPAKHSRKESSKLGKTYELQVSAWPFVRRLDLEFNQINSKGRFPAGFETRPYIPRPGWRRELPKSGRFYIDLIILSDVSINFLNL